ncbi:prolyl oligopeptidase family serine peptidase [Sphingosinicella soli]|uniref:Dipeptidyl aminopeptidase/acylaminoacyl peptidase n=1 Tax=Sphingosinicella soli TaxID=333708 RepID=A0A7W7AZN4_9SPHN|nr:dipeptidyl aminopeptidase/acylaminoacyl peptidase [Sphingosinicella soli]
MYRILGSFALLASSGLALAAPSAVVPDDHYRLADVAEPQFSPDGAAIIYTVTAPDRDRDEKTSDLWTVPWKGGAPAPLTQTPEVSEYGARYMPDGKTVVFLSDAGEKKDGEDEEDDSVQLWRMSANGGAGTRITSLPGGISGYDLSPDGKFAVVVAEVGKTVGSKAKTPPPIETERFYFKQDGRGYLDDRTQQLFIVDLATGAARQLTQGARDHWRPAWSPDGKLIAYTAKDHAGDKTLNSEIYVLPPEGGEPRKISPTANADDDPDWSAGVSWSPDSRRIVWLEGIEDKWLYYGAPHLAVADVSTGAVTRPAKLDLWFYYPRFAPDGSILAQIEGDRDTWLARVDAESGKISYLTQGTRFAYDYAVAKDGRIAVLETTNEKPSELYALEKSGARQLTDHNPWLKDRALGETRDVSFKSGDAEIHGFYVLPPDYDAAKRYPLVADLHGGPVYQHSHEFDLDARALAAAGYVVLKINPRGSSGRGFDFSRAIYADWGNVDAQDISAGITNAVETGIADANRIGVGGWSYGGILSGYMIAYDKRIKAAVAGAGVSNIFATWGVDMYQREYILELGTPWENFETWKKLAYPFFEPERITAATLFQCADADDNVPCVGAEQMYLTLKTRGVPTKLIVYPGENHGLTVPSYLSHRIAANIAWYDRWLKAD